MIRLASFSSIIFFSISRIVVLAQSSPISGTIHLPETSIEWGIFESVLFSVILFSMGIVFYKLEVLGMGVLKSVRFRKFIYKFSKKNRFEKKIVREV